jgi:hypothetical protein
MPPFRLFGLFALTAIGAVVAQAQTLPTPKPLDPSVLQISRKTQETSSTTILELNAGRQLPELL